MNKPLAVQPAHTPGPWKARDYATDDGDIWVDCDAWKHRGRGGLLGGTVATVLRSGAEDQGTVEANARLIAQAPALVAALESAAISMDNVASILADAGHDIASAEHLTACAMSARAAIAAARGQS